MNAYKNIDVLCTGTVYSSVAEPEQPRARFFVAFFFYKPSETFKAFNDKHFDPTEGFRKLGAEADLKTGLISQHW